VSSKWGTCQTVAARTPRWTAPLRRISDPTPTRTKSNPWRPPRAPISDPASNSNTFFNATTFPRSSARDRHCRTWPRVQHIQHKTVDASAPASLTKRRQLFGGMEKSRPKRQHVASFHVAPCKGMATLNATSGVASDTVSRRALFFYYWPEILKKISLAVINPAPSAQADWCAGWWKQAMRWTQRRIYVSWCAG